MSNQAAQTMPDGPLSGKYGDVLRPFVIQMERELHANAGKGDRPGWLKMSPEVALLEIYYHLAKLQKAVKDDNGPGIQEYAADVANMSMMLLDICGGLALIEYAAPAASGGEAGASVSERARDERFTAMLIGIIADVQDALGFTDEDKECSNGSLEIVAAIRELQEQALTQQRVCATCGGRGEIGGHVGQTAETFDYVTEPCPECTTPQPSADAVRELVKRWRGIAETNFAQDRLDKAIEISMDNTLRDCADELESLLSGGSHA